MSRETDAIKIQEVYEQYGVVSGNKAEDVSRCGEASRASAMVRRASYTDSKGHNAIRDILPHVHLTGKGSQEGDWQVEALPDNSNFTRILLNRRQRLWLWLGHRGGYTKKLRDWLYRFAFKWKLVRKEP